MNVTKDRALGYRSEAVGAAAMVVEFGLNHHDGGNDVKGANGGGGVGSNNNNNFRERSGSVEGVEKGMDMEQQSRRRTVAVGEVGKFLFCCLFGIQFAVFRVVVWGTICSRGDDEVDAKSCSPLTFYSSRHY